MKFEYPSVKLQYFIKTNLREVASVLFVLLVLLLAWIIKLKVKPADISPPTQQEYEAAGKIRQKDCGCWDGVVEICLPDKVCLMRELDN